MGGFFIMTDISTQPQDFFSQPETILDPLHLDLDEFQVVRTVKDNIKDSTDFYASKNLKQKQARNVKYYLGEQELYKASNKAKPYKENIIYEGISRQKPIALSRMPDLTVKPGDEEPETKETAEKLSGIFNSDTKKRDNRKLLGLCTKLEPLYYFAVIKAIWNPEKGMFGDYEFISVHPDNVVFDHNCSESDADQMRFVSEKRKLPLKEMIMMFPDKEKEIKEEFGWADNDNGEDRKMATPVNLIETWFHWYELKGSESERIDGVVWIYGNLMLKKMKNPHFDYQGRKKLFTLEMEEKNAYTMDEIIDMISDQDGEDDKIYNNYFQDPRKPYFFMVYENMGKHPISETSRVEQVLEFQDNINMGGSIIADQNIRARGKDLFDTNAITQATLDNTNLYDIDQVLGLDVPQGQSINNVHSRIEQKAATAQQYRSLETDRQKGFEMLGVGAENRGLSESDTTLGQSQMAREGDFSLIDDIVEDTINAAAEWQSQWAMQFIKLRYTKPHMRHILGKDGEVLHMKLTQDMVDNGMEVVVSASGVDKTMRQRLAMENMKLGIGDPLSYYEDTEQSNPKERAKRAMLAQMAPQMYMQEYLMDEEADPNAPLTAQALGQPPAPEQPQQPPQAPQAPMGGGGWQPKPVV